MSLNLNISQMAQVWAELDGMRVSAGEQKVDAQLYIKIGNIEATNKTIRAHVHFITGGSSTSRIYELPADLGGRNFIAQAYEYLKTLPEFAGATDM